MKTLVTGIKKLLRPFGLLVPVVTIMLALIGVVMMVHATFWYISTAEVTTGFWLFEITRLPGVMSLKWFGALTLTFGLVFLFGYVGLVGDYRNGKQYRDGGFWPHFWSMWAGYTILFVLLVLTRW